MRVNIGREGNASSSLSSNGGAMIGPLILANGPSQPLEAATKYYVDTVFANLNANNVLDGILPISALPSFTGDATSSQGSNSFALANLGVTPGNYAKVIVDAKGRVTGNDVLSGTDIPNFNWDKVTGEPNTLAGYGITDALSTSGGILVGNLTVPNPVQPMNVINKQYADSSLNNNSAEVGDIIRKAYATTPAGFLRCNGGIISKTTYADLYTVIGDNYNIISTPGAGQPWRQQYDINNTQSGDITAWITGTALPDINSQSAVIVTKNRVYLLGGVRTNSISISTVYTAPINNDGTLGTWVSGTALPVALGFSQVIVTKNRVYLLGGESSGVEISSIYSAIINADGTIGNWSLSGSLQTAVTNSQAIITKNRVYLIGGATTAGVTSVVQTAIINEDGTLGTWSAGTPLPINLGRSQAVVTKNRVYLLGGYNGTINITVSYTAPINADGTLGTWETGTSLNTAVYYARAYITKNRVYLIGGKTNSTTSVATIQTAAINVDGTIGAWSIGTPLPGVLSGSQIIVTKNRIYCLGGWTGSATSVSTVYTASISSSIQDYSPYYEVIIDPNNYMMPGSGQPWKQQYQINTTQTNVLGSWTSVTPLIDGIALFQAIVTKNRVYLLGGLNTNFSENMVYTAPINSDGTLGTWTTGTSLPGNLYSSQAVVTKNRVYLLGGRNGPFNASNYLSTVYTAPINSDGTLGSWVTDTSLPINLSDSQLVITSNRVYLLGGKSTNISIRSSIYTASINADGTLGSWSNSGMTLPVTLCYSQVAVTKNRVYLLGGSTDGNNAVSNVYTAPINTNGTLGTWSSSASLPGVSSLSQVFITGNRVYLCSGYNGTSNISTVYTAPINSDGTLGTWTTDSNLPIAISEAQVIAVSNNLYFIGGFTSAYKTTVYNVSITGSSNDYSSFYDGTITYTTPIVPVDETTLFALPDFTGKEKNGISIYIKY